MGLILTVVSYSPFASYFFHSVRYVFDPVMMNQSHTFNNGFGVMSYIPPFANLVFHSVIICIYKVVMTNVFNQLQYFQGFARFFLI